MLACMQQPLLNACQNKLSRSNQSIKLLPNKNMIVSMVYYIINKAFKRTGK